MGINNAAQRFVNYFGELGARWGLPANACRIHAYLYLKACPISETSINEELQLEPMQLAEALAFLIDFRMIEPIQSTAWQTSADPWDMLATGLEERRRRELSPALAALRSCHRDALNEKSDDKNLSIQMGKMLALVENLAALDHQVQRLSPQFLRGLVNVSTRTAKFMDRLFGATQRGK